MDGLLLDAVSDASCICQMIPLIPEQLPVFFAPLAIGGAVIASWVWRRDRALSEYAVFVWMLFIAGLVSATVLLMEGTSQLFFFYYGIVALTTIAACGLSIVVREIQRRPALQAIAAILLVTYITAQAITPRGLPWNDPWVTQVWAGAKYWRDDLFLDQSDATLRLEQRTSCPQPQACTILFVTSDIRNGLEWMRQHTPKDSVFAVNVFGGSAYGIYSERRAFFETTSFNSDVEAAHYSAAAAERVAGWRVRIQESWQAGNPETLSRMKQAGITYLLVDHLNGTPVPPLPGLALPVYDSQDLTIYRVP